TAGQHQRLSGDVEHAAIAVGGPRAALHVDLAVDRELVDRLAGAKTWDTMRATRGDRVPRIRLLPVLRESVVPGHVEIAPDEVHVAVEKDAMAFRLDPHVLGREIDRSGRQCRRA